MDKYKEIIIIHALDNSTLFLRKFKSEFKEIYRDFSSDKDSINHMKYILGDLEPKSLIIYLGHGSSSGLYTPDNTYTYDNYFLDTSWANHFFDKHDIFLLTCKSNEFIKKIHKSHYSLGFGNIISSKEELDIDNKNKDIKKELNSSDIDKFNNIYMNSSISAIKLLISGEIRFRDLPIYLRYYLNKEINIILLDKEKKNRKELAKLLFELRNSISIKRNLNPN
ncbi:hypothetical protein UJ101_01709 [Flavobacteriaceae bacterium UJ101]|nr:hypothetical protein UJ101_01709 [Flavobacteriaceae bacterium UJ101]